MASKSGGSGGGTTPPGSAERRRAGGRPPIPKPVRRRVIEANAGVCCVCKRRGIGFEIHHLDEDPSNNVEENLVVLCPTDHDQAHRPHRYTARAHGELGAAELRRHKRDWEWFVAAAGQPEPPVAACLTFYLAAGIAVGSAKLVFQGSDKKTYLERTYDEHTSGPPEAWADAICDEIAWLGPNIKLLTVSEPLPIEHCADCRGKLGGYRSYAQVVDLPLLERLTRLDWAERSVMSVYVNPTRPSLAVRIGYSGCEDAYCVLLHRCGDRVRFADGKGEWAVPIRPGRSARTLVTREVERLRRRWRPGAVLVGTGDPDRPELIGGLHLPLHWEAMHGQRPRR